MACARCLFIHNGECPADPPNNPEPSALLPCPFCGAEARAAALREAAELVRAMKVTAIAASHVKAWLTLAADNIDSLARAPKPKETPDE